MAIYKPTDMSPNQTSFSFDDVTTDEAIVFECLTDTSNTLANALSIELYSYDGEKVFGFADEQDVSSITLMTDLQQYCLTNFSSILRGYKYPNSGINGTYIKLPFAVDISKKPSSGNTLLKNQIYKTTIDGEIKFVDYDNNVLDIFEGQKYFWNIQLYQLEKNENDEFIIPVHPKYCDMKLTEGYVMGSTNKRIQSVKSDNIFADYFLQPVNIPGVQLSDDRTVWYTASQAQNIIHNRAIVKSYDYSYGHIYVDESVLSKQEMNAQNVNAFRIYKTNNNPDDLTAYQKVSYVIDKPIQYRSSAHTDGLLWIKNDTGDSYYTQTWSSSSSPAGKYSPPGFGDITFSGGERVVFNHQVQVAIKYGDTTTIRETGVVSDDTEYLGSAFNGIFYPEFSTTEETDTWTPSVTQWSSSTQYYKNNVVHRAVSGATWDFMYLCIKKNKGAGLQNEEYWKRIAEKYASENAYYKGESVWKGTAYTTLYKCLKSYPSTETHDPASSPDYWEPYILNVTETNYKHTAKWLRAPDANTFGGLLSKICLVVGRSSPYYGQNIQINNISKIEDTYGTINVTPFKFEPERPVQLYENSYDDWSATKEYKKFDVVKKVDLRNVTNWSSTHTYSIGDMVSEGGRQYICLWNDITGSRPSLGSADWTPIYRTKTYVSKTTNTNSNPETNPNDWYHNEDILNTGIVFYNQHINNSGGRLYIRPFTGLHRGQLWLENTSDPIKRMFFIDEVNTDYWYVKYSGKNVLESGIFNYDSQTGEVEPVRYFYPTIDKTRYSIMTFFRKSDDAMFGTYTKPEVEISAEAYDEFNVKVSGTYDQNQFVHWQKAQLFLYDSDKETIVDKSPVLTYGKLEYTFYCLDSGHEYWPKLVIENDEGYVVEKFTDSAYIPNYRIINCEEQVPQLDFVDSMFDAKDLSYKSSIEMGPNSDKLYVYKKNIWYTINKNSGNPTYHEDNKYSLVAISENDTGSSKDLPIKDYNILNRRDYVYVYRFIKGSHPGNVYQIKKIAQDICWYGWTLAETRQTIIEDKIAYSIDSDNIWRFKYNVSTGAQVQNIIKQQQDTIGKYPKFFSGKKNVISGQVTCLLGKDFACANYVNNEYRYEDSSGEIIINKTDGSIKNIGGYNDGTDVNNMFDFTSKFSVDFLNKWRKVCYSGNPKILRDEKGQAFIVQIYDTSNQTNEQWNGMAETISFSWTEIGSIDGVSVIYTKDGDDGRLYPSETLYPNITLFPTE